MNENEVPRELHPRTPNVIIGALVVPILGAGLLMFVYSAPRSHEQVQNEKILKQGILSSKQPYRLLMNEYLPKEKGPWASFGDRLAGRPLNPPPPAKAELVLKLGDTIITFPRPTYADLTDLRWDHDVQVYLFAKSVIVAAQGGDVKAPYQARFEISPPFVLKRTIRRAGQAPLVHQFQPNLDNCLLGGVLSPNMIRSPEASKMR